MADAFKFRIDHHGSLVRPRDLLAARRQGLDAGDLRAAEDRAIAEAVRMQRKLGLSVVTDGEFRRADFRGAVLDAVHGFRRAGGQTGDGLARWVAHDELKPGGPLVADGAAAVAAQTLVPTKATLPSPAYLAAQCFEPGGHWASARALGEALARIVHDEIDLLVSRGIRYIQLTNPAYLTGGGLSLDDAIAVDTIAVTLAAKPGDVRIGVCPAYTAPADPAAARKLFAALPVDRWMLPFDTGSDAELALLRAVPEDRDACLGIVDPTVPDLEDVEGILARMDRAAEVKGVEDLAVSPSAGFAPVADAAALSEEQQWRKLVHVETIARMCWGNEL